MTEIEKKAEEFLIKEYHLIRPKRLSDNEWENYVKSYSIEFKAYKDGYEQGQKDFDTDVTKLLNSYGVTFIDTNSIGGLIGLHQIMLDLEKENELLKSKIKNVYEVRQKAQSEIIIDLEKENEELKAQIEKMKCCQNCKHNDETVESNLHLCCHCDFLDKWEIWELAE